MDHREELIRQVNQLLRTLKQILKTGGLDNSQSWKDETGKNITLNICVFDVSHFEDDDGYENGLEDMLAEAEERAEGFMAPEPIKFELTSRDVDFLKANGLSF